MINPIKTALVRLIFVFALLAGCGGADEPTQSVQLAKEKQNEQNQLDSIQADTQAFVSSSGITQEEFTTTVADFIGGQVKKEVSGIQIDSLRDGLNIGISGGEPEYNREEMSASLEKVELSLREQENPYTPQAEDAKIISYTLGYIQGLQLVQLSVPVELDKFIEVFERAYQDGSARTAAESEQIISTYINELEQSLRQATDALDLENLQQSKNFLASNRNKTGVMETPSGLQYEIIAEGDGDKPVAEDTVQVHYRGSLLNGDEFDSSYNSGQPAEFPLSSVILGWTEGLQLMSLGSKYRFFIPPELGYGKRGSPPNIGPNELLIFEVELLKIL